MSSKRLVGLIAFFGASLLFSLQTNATVITEGFEGSSYDFYTGSGAAELSTSVVHSGSQSVYLSIPTGSDYSRVSIPESGFSLGSVSAADYWVYRTSTSVNENPYLILGLNCPSCGYGSDDIIAIMWNPHDIGINPTQNQWFDVGIDPNTTLFHLYDNTTNANLIPNTTLAGLDPVWGNASVSYVKIALGLAGNDATTYSYYVDDLSISSTPIPPALPLFAAGLAAIGLFGWYSKRSIRNRLA